jgi:hypothetical protein
LTVFGRRKSGPKTARPGQELAVDAGLEGDVSGVEAAVDAYLADQCEDRRQALLKALETLDTETVDSDAYASRVAWRSVLAVPSPDVIGETSSHPIAEDIPSSEFAGQITLVKSAKQCVLHPNPGTVAALEAAQAALGRFRNQMGSGPG